MNFSAADHVHMARALRLTERGRQTATPNPAVGCVIVKQGRVIGEGWHERAGQAHAEVRALESCRESPQGGTVYVTLEPCAHHGRTPPCADALIRAGVARVVSAIQDPDPRVAGRGLRRLNEAGIRAECGLMADGARLAHRGFLSRIERGRPWVLLKAGASLDGRTALANGESRWITSAEARRDVHRMRARSCALLTGMGTIRTDDPDLTVRDVPCQRQPVRIVVDSRLEIPDSARLLQTEPVWIMTASANEERMGALRARGHRVEQLPVLPDKAKIDLAALMTRLGELGVNELMVETGAGLNGSLIDAGLVDEVLLYSAPTLLGDTAMGLACLAPLSDLGSRQRLSVSDIRRIGPDVRITARMEHH